MEITLKSTIIALLALPFGLHAAQQSNPNAAFLSPSWKSQRVTAVSMVSQAKAQLTKDKVQTKQQKPAQPAVQQPEKQTHQQFIAQMRAQVAQAEKAKEAQLQQAQEEHKKSAAQVPETIAPVVKIVSLMPRSLQPVKPCGYNKIAPKRAQILKDLQAKLQGAQLEAEADSQAIRATQCKDCAHEYLDCTLYTSAQALQELAQMQKAADEFDDISMKDLKKIIAQKAEYNQNSRKFSEFKQRAIAITREIFFLGQCSDHKKVSTHGA